MTLRERLANNFAVNKEDVKSSLLSRSLLWMGLGLATIILVTYLSLTVPVFYEATLRITFTSWIVMFLIDVLLIFSMFFTLKNPNVHIIIPALLYILFSIYQGSFIAVSFIFAGVYNIKEVILIMLIPAGIFIFMGLLAYFNVINFTKLMPFVFFGFLGLLIMSITLIFVDSVGLEKWYFLLAGAIFTIWIGFDIQRIKRAEDIYQTYGNEIDKKIMNRIAFIFGINLFIDFINLLLILIRFIGILRD